MKKFMLFLLVILIMFSFTSCFEFSDPKEVEEMFNSFNHSDNYVLLTHFQLVVKGKHYERSEIKYNGKDTNILFLDENGFYSYAYNNTNLRVEFLYTTYDDFKVTELGEATLPNNIINSFYGDNCFWFRMIAPSDDKSKQVYYCWNTLDKTEKMVENVDDDYEYSPDNNRSKDYSFSYKSLFFIEELTIVNNETDVKKTINKSILKTFEEGREIRKFKSSTVFTARKAYVIDDDIYFVSSFGVDTFADNMYLYLVKWNFNTEECTFITSTCFDYYQEWVDDFIIINQ